MRGNLVSASLSATAALVLLAGCAGNLAPASAPPALLQSTSRAAMPATRLPAVAELQPAFAAPEASSCAPSAACLLFVSAAHQNDVEGYSVTDQSATLVSSIVGTLNDPQGMAASGNDLLVVEGDGPSILEFSTKNPPKLIRTLQDPLGDPEDVAAAGDGNIYTTDIIGQAGNNGDVLLFAPKHNKGKRIGDNNLLEVFFVAVKHDDSEICVDGLPRTGPAEVDCTTNAGKTWKNTGYSLGFPGGLAFDTAGNLVVDDQAGVITDEGTGVTVACPGHDCVGIAFGPNDTHLYTADATTGTAYQIDWADGSIDFALSKRKQNFTFAQPIPGA